MENQFTPEEQQRELVQIVKQITATTKFPIGSFDDLVDAMGGEKATLKFLGQSHTLAELRDRIPSYYFPIGSERDLVAKFRDLAKARPRAFEEAPFESALKLLPPVAARPE